METEFLELFPESYFVNLIVIELFVDLGVRAKIQIQYVFSHFSPSG